MIRSQRVDERPLSAFRQMLRSEVSRPTARPIPTSSAEQASIIIETFFTIAESTIRIVTGGLNARIYSADSVIVEAKKFLANPSHDLKILFLKRQNPEIRETHPLLRSLCSYRNMKLAYAPEAYSEKFTFHFSVVDDHAYRFKHSADGHASIVSFGDKQFAGELNKIFDTLMSVSQPIRELAAA